MSVLAENSGREPADERRGDFSAHTEPYRRELLAHCYRMTGSLHDAEDLVQETLLRAWKAYEGFAGKSSLRTWLHRIATNTCLTALEGRRRRPLPTGLGRPSADPSGELVERREVSWLEPLPDVTDDPADPSTIVGNRESVRLAFVAALQHLSPRQRAVLLLRDVLQWKSAEVADAIGTSTVAVNSLLQRARSQLQTVRPSAADRLSAPDSPEAQDLLARYIAAFEAYDIDRLVELFTAEAIWEMPPYTDWYQGAQAIVTLIHQQCPAYSPSWLKSRHSFSFGDHYDPDNTHHGLLLVNNDDQMEPASGFDPHPHRDMEIVTWVLRGALRHQDSAGNSGVIYPGLAQRMSAGTGILHSEMNDSATEPVHFVQMWVIPDATGITASYQQQEIDDELLRAGLVTIASGIPGQDAALTLHNSSASLHGARLRPGATVSLPCAPFLHLFVAYGRLTLEGGGELADGDAVRFTDADARGLTANEPSEVLIWEMHAKLGDSAT